MNKREVGTFYEQMASEYLNRQGIRIIERNFRCRIGEIDLIGLDKDDTLVFFEVKYRKSNSYQNPLEAVNYNKQRKIIKTAQYYLMIHDSDKACRFDVVGITGESIEWIKNAFYA